MKLIHQRPKKVAQTFLQCECCKTVIPTYRFKSHEKKDGFVNITWCFKCKETTRHLEYKKYYEKNNINFN